MPASIFSVIGVVTAHTLLQPATPTTINAARITTSMAIRDFFKIAIFIFFSF